MGLRSRRELLSTGLGIGAVSAVFGPGARASAVHDPASELSARQRDLRVLQGLLDGERLLQYCYGQVLGSKALGPACTDVVLVAYVHEQAHASAIQAAVNAVGAQLAGLEISLPRVRRPAPRRAHHSSEAQPFPPPQIVKLFHSLHKEPYCITQLGRVEAYVQSKYFHAVAELSEPELVRTAAEILACKAQQWSLFQDLLSRGKVMHTVPSAFVRGSATLPK